MQTTASISTGIGGAPAPTRTARPDLDRKPGRVTITTFIALLLAGLAYSTISLTGDVQKAGPVSADWLPYLLLGVALLIALGFEFVNGFHDTANAVATVIYTHSLAPNVAVMWSGTCNFLGVLFSSGAVAFGIISLLPVELILQVGSSSGFAMVFALLIAAICWNLGTWWFGLPASSSHTMIGSIIGVGVANALMHGRDGTSGVDWEQAAKVGYSLLLSPLVGFVCAALLLMALRMLVKNRELYEAPSATAPPPWWIRGWLILTCSGVSFAHGSNDGQKGMGLIMLILVGTVPMAYALNRAMPANQVDQFVAVARVTQQSLLAQPTLATPTASSAATAATPAATLAAPATSATSAATSAATPAATPAPRQVLQDYIRTKTMQPQVVPALAALTGAIGGQVQSYGTLANVPAQIAGNVRNDMYLVAEAIRVLGKDKSVRFDVATQTHLITFKGLIDDATKFIPLWVKVAVAIALSLGTMVGWKRIVVTVGEKIGKSHLTYAQGASAEMVAMLTIGAADLYGLPVSTTHVLSSGVAGTMAANRSGLQLATLRNLAMAWILTLPVAMLLSGVLYWLFSQVF